MEFLRLTGNPLVDVGLATAANLAGKTSVAGLTQDDLRTTVAAMLAQMKELEGIRLLGNYWQNSPFAGKNLGQRESYTMLIRSLAEQTELIQPGYCQVCGIFGVMEINRCWMPLAGSVESDPCTLPGLGAKLVCPNCFCAILLLPRGCKTCKTGGYLYHFSDDHLLVEAVAPGVQAITTAILSKGSGSDSVKEKTTLSNRLELLEIASGSRWGSEEGLSRIPPDGATILSFSNSGTSPRTNWLYLPAQALSFFEAINEAGIQPTFVKFAKASSDRKYRFHDQLCDDIETRRSFSPILTAIIQSRPSKKQTLSKEESLMLQIYEDIALQRKDRFDALERLSDAVNTLSEIKRESFLKQLSNIKTKEIFLRLLVEFQRRADLKISRADLRILDSSSWKETISLLYLLCVAEE